MTKIAFTICYFFYGDKVKVKIFDESHEKDLEDDINNFMEEQDIKIIEIQYQVSASISNEEQIYCFSAMILYLENE